MRPARGQHGHGVRPHHHHHHHHHHHQPPPPSPLHHPPPPPSPTNIHHHRLQLDIAVLEDGLREHHRLQQAAVNNAMDCSRRLEQYIVREAGVTISSSSSASASASSAARGGVGPSHTVYTILGSLNDQLGDLYASCRRNAEVVRSLGSVPPKETSGGGGSGGGGGGGGGSARGGSSVRDDGSTLGSRGMNALNEDEVGHRQHTTRGSTLVI